MRTPLPTSPDRIAGLIADLREMAELGFTSGSRDVCREAAAELARLPELERDAARLDALTAEYWKLDPFDMPTGAGDADVGWRVVQYHQGIPHERTVAEVYEDNPRKAIDAAIAASVSTGEAVGENG